MTRYPRSPPGDRCAPDKLRVPLVRKENGVGVGDAGCCVFVQLYPVIPSLLANFPYEIA